MKKLIFAALIAMAGCSHTKQVEPQSAKEPQPDSMPKSLLEPGATKKIQGALSHQDFAVKSSGSLDDSTRAALIKFQNEKGLPDRETIRRLDLDPDEIYRSVGKDKSKD